MYDQELSFIGFLYDKKYPPCVVIKYRNFINDFADTIKVLPENAIEKDVLKYINKIITKSKFTPNKISSFLAAFDLFFNKYYNRKIPITFKNSENSDTKIPEFLTYPELLLFFSKTKNDIFRKIFALMYLLGLKPIEVMNIELIHYNEKQRCISFVKKKEKPNAYFKSSNTNYFTF